MESIIEVLSRMPAGHLAGSAALLAVALSAIIEISPIKVNPWSWIARKIGRAINGEVIEKVEKLEADLGKLRDTVDERAAKDARTRILRFGDECLHGDKHSKEHFDQILRDITDYEEYCDHHKDFKNNTAVLTIGSIKSIYQQRLRDHDFL